MHTTLHPPRAVRDPVFWRSVLSGRGIMREADGRIVDGHWEEGMPSVRFAAHGRGVVSLR